MAEEVVTLRRLTQQKREATCEGLVKGEVPGMEFQAAAALLVTLKMCCGLNDSSEHHLSVVASRVNGTLMGGCDVHPPLSPLFSFDEWMRYVGVLCSDGLVYSSLISSSLPSCSFF